MTSPRLERKLSPPQAKSPSVLHQSPIVELKTMALVHQNDEPVSDNFVPNKIQQVLFAYYPTPPPTPDYYLGEDLEASNSLDCEDCQPPPSTMMLKWYNSDEDSCCPKEKNILAEGLQQSNWKENSFGDSKLLQDI